MRYFLSGLSLVLAVIFLLLGVGQRTIWAPADTISHQLEDAVESPALILTSDVLHAYDGRQTIEINGAEGQPITAAVGKLSDILGWVGLANYDVAQATESGFTVIPVAGSENTLPQLSGSDMWVQEQRGESTITFTVDAPEEYAIIIVSDGTQPAPSDVRVTWNYLSTTPWFGPTMTAGFVFLGLALLFLALALRRHRKHRGPQRKLSPKPSRRERREIQKSATKALEGAPVAALPAADPVPDDASPQVPDADQANAETESESEMPARPTEAQDAPDTDASEQSGRTARVAHPLRKFRFVAPVAIVALVLTGCTSSDWPSFEEPAETSATPEPTSIEDTLPDPALTVRQFDRVLANTRAVVAEADQNRDINLAATRLDGAVLAARQSAYEVLGTDGEAMDITGIPDGSVSLVLPQQSEVWPRSVLTIVQWADSTRTPSALVFEQRTAREPFRVIYQFELEPGATATGAAADVGAAGLPADTPLLQVQPQAIASQYARVLLDGEGSEFASQFVLENEALNAQIGQQAWNEFIGSEDYALVDFTREVSEDDLHPVTLVASPDGAAYVSTSFTLTSTARISADGEGATIQLAGAERVLAGIEETGTGTSTVYQVQVMFLVPPASAPDSDQVTVIGYSYNLIDASEVTE